MWGLGQSDINSHYSEMLKTLMGSSEKNGRNKEFIINPNVKESSIQETKFKLKLDNPSPEPQPQDMGSSIPTNDNVGMDAPMEEPNDKPFDDVPFDAGVEADEEKTPDKYIQQLAGKLGQSLRSYTQDNGTPNFELEKFAINSVLSATNSGEMDQKDQSDIIAKVKSATTNSGGEPNIDLSDETSDRESTDDEEPSDGDGDIDNGGIDLSDIDMEESHNPNHNKNTVFQDMTLGVKNGGMEENKYLNLENASKSSIFVSKTIKDMVKESLRTEREPVTTPRVKPTTEPVRRLTRESKPWRVNPQVTPEPKANEGNDKNVITYINSEPFSKNNQTVVVTFDVGEVRFVEAFTYTGEIIEKPKAYDEPWLYDFRTDILSNGKQYAMAVSFYGQMGYGEEPDGFTHNIPDIEEV
jgi:hypothetical protein